MSQHEGYVSSNHPTHVCKLNKALYDLKQAPKAWFDILKSTLLKKRLNNSMADTSLFILNKIEVFTLILVYVDDIIIIGGNTSYIATLILELNVECSLKDLGDIHFFLGSEVKKRSQ